jgi:hypothetical protein
MKTFQPSNLPTFKPYIQRSNQMCADHRHGGPQESLENLRQPMSLGRKLYLFVRNNWKKLRTGSRCCGNHGEPGC